jgi:hypothetical protein
MSDENTTPVETVEAPPTVEAQPDIPAWDGTVESLAKNPWWEKVPEDVRPHLETGLKSVHGTWAKGFNAKFQEFSGTKKSWEQKEREYLTQIAQIKSDWDTLRTWSDGDDDAVKRAIEAERTTWNTERASLDTELNELRAYRDEVSRIAEEEQAKEMTAIENQIRSEYSDVLKVDPAADFFEKLVASGVDLPEAADIVRVKFKLTRPAPPLSAQMASRGDAPAARVNVPTQARSLAELRQATTERVASRLGHTG